MKDLMSSVRKDIPEYAAQPLRRFLDYCEESYRLLHLSMRGVSGLRGMPRLVAALKPFETDEDDAEPRRKSLEDAKQTAEFANKECESGFPLLHAHTLVGIWGAFEAAIEDMLVGLLVNEPDLLRDKAFAKMRVSLAQFELLEREERMRLLLAELGRGEGAARTTGVDSFEALLDCFNLSGPVSPDTKKSIWEMNHVRNVIVHRGSLADRRLVEACPWMNLKLGDRLTVAHDQLEHYGGVLCDYALSITYRLGERYDVDIDAKIGRSGDALQIPHTTK